MLHFRVADAGPGFDPDSVARGSGLQNMQDRLEALGGSLVIMSRPGAGTTVHGRIPMSSP
jgi:signal transduction histidine kinase